MIKLLFTAIVMTIMQIALCQPTYTFTGNGNWSIVANWSNNILPPSVAPSGSEVIINPAIGGQCILDVHQSMIGAKLTIIPGAIFVVKANLDLGNLPTLASVTIGTQIWLAKNLDVAVFRNGDSIPEVQDPVAWSQLQTGAWCYYENNSANGIVYGKMYNWYAVNDPRGLAPAGWHVASDAEWKTLTAYLGGTNTASGNTVAGGPLKDTTAIWNSPNTGATNSSGFKALPGGNRYANGSFFSLGYVGLWWTSTEATPDISWYRSMSYTGTTIVRNTVGKGYGYSVRCIKN